MVKVVRESVLRVADVMTHGVSTIPSGTPLPEAALQLANARITGAPVVSSTGRPLGMVSRADLLDPRHMIAGATVDDAMTRVLFGVRRSDPAMAAAKLMVAQKIHRVVVVDDDGALVGILTAMDMMRALVESADKDVTLEFVDLAARFERHP